MTEKTPEQLEAEGYVGTSPEQLAQKSDAELAIWQKGWKPQSAEYILADREWQRRLAMRQLEEQFRLDERLARANGWWSLRAAAIGVIGALGGAWLGAYWTSEYSRPKDAKTSSAIVQPSAPADALQRAAPASARR
jgi:hypothetical protein